MDSHVYKKIEVTGTSTTGTDDAINNAITKAAQSVKHIQWFEVIETRGNVENGKVKHWQVTLKLGFRLDD